MKHSLIIYSQTLSSPIRENSLREFLSVDSSELYKHSVNTFYQITIESKCLWADKKIRMQF